MPVSQFTLKGKHDGEGHLQFDETAWGKETVLLKNVEAYTRTVIYFQVERRQQRASQ
jgi:hypothetical protein